MTLQAIILRAEGALAETEEARRKAFAQVFAEAGFDWTCDREGFALSAKLGNSPARMAHYVRRELRGRKESEDFSLLIQAMHRRAVKICGDTLAASTIEPRPGMRELLIAAKAEGLKLALVSLLKREDVENLATAVLGARGRDMFDMIVTETDGDADACKRLYQKVAETMQPVGLNHCLVIEAGLLGAEAARAAGFSVLTTRSAFCADSVLSRTGALVIEDLTRLMPARDPVRRHDPLTADERSELLAMVMRLHAKNCECIDQDGSSHMRVSDILKAKGSAVKSISPDATVRSFAHGLRTEIVGAMLVIDASGDLKGIISERDIARGIDEYGSDLPAMRVADLMTRSVITCAPEDDVASVASTMTERRIRHIPVVVNRKVVGLVSIGDVLKHRLDEVQLEASILRDVALVRR
jgi:CBS domain-containing protein/beta-phosphoglucomutase-like phosphatase (HAD superfamily)